MVNDDDDDDDNVEESYNARHYCQDCRLCQQTDEDDECDNKHSCPCHFAAPAYDDYGDRVDDMMGLPLYRDLVTDLIESAVGNNDDDDDAQRDDNNNMVYVDTAENPLLVRSLSESIVPDACSTRERFVDAVQRHSLGLLSLWLVGVAGTAVWWSRRQRKGRDDERLLEVNVEQANENKVT